MNDKLTIRIKKANAEDGIWYQRSWQIIDDVWYDIKYNPKTFEPMWLDEERKD